MKVEYINPFVASTMSVFSTMLNCQLKRGKIFIKSAHQPEFLVSGIIGLTGRAVGTVVLSMGRDTALWATEALLGSKPEEINAEVVDAVGELANMVAGGAKAQLAQFDLSLTIPTVITGRSYCVGFPSEVPPICIPFEAPFGELSVEVGFVEKDQPARGEPAMAGASA